MRVLGVTNFCATMIFGQHHASDIHFPAADVRVDIDTASHDHTAARVNGFIYRIGVCWRFDHTTVSEIQVNASTANIVTGVVNFAALNSCEHDIRFILYFDLSLRTVANRGLIRPT